MSLKRKTVTVPGNLWVEKPGQWAMYKISSKREQWAMYKISGKREQCAM